MPYTAGVFSLVAGNPVVTGTIVSSTWANNTLTDIASGLSTAVLKDGTQTTTALIPFSQGISAALQSTFAQGIAITTGGVAFGGGTLGNYIENGSWTPGIKFGATVSGIAYGTQNGLYTKVGNLVHASYIIQLTTRGSSTGAAVLTGLPVPSGNFGYTVSSTDWNLFTSSMLYVQLSLGPNTSSAVFKGMTASATSLQPMVMSQFAENSLIQGGSLTYLT
jgi:hypothetical protein